MKWLLLAAALQQQWYVGHLGAEECVPLNDIGSNFERLHYGAGTMHTPEDLTTHFRKLGSAVTTVMDKDYDNGARMMGEK